MWARLRLVFRSLFGWMLRGIENPELILRQHIDDLRSRIPEFNRQAAEIVKLEKMLEMQRDRLREKVTQLDAQVRRAVALGPEKKEAAKALITALETAKTELAETEAQLVQAKANSDQVKKARLAYERRVQQRIQEAMRQISRAKRAEIEKQMSELMMSFEVNDDSEVLDRMTSRIDEDLARATAQREIASESVGTQMASLEFDVVEADSDRLYEEYQRQMGLAPQEKVARSLDPIAPETATAEAPPAQTEETTQQQ